MHRVGENGDWEINNGIRVPDNRTNHQVNGLQPFTVYSFQIVAVSSKGLSPPSKESYYMVTLREGKPYTYKLTSTTLLLLFQSPLCDVIREGLMNISRYHPIKSMCMCVCFSVS